MPSPDLPPEVWSQIFDLAAEEGAIFDRTLPTCMATSTWFKMPILGSWALRTPEDNVSLLQRRSYATKKAIIMTCHLWRQLGSEFLFRCLFFEDPARLDLVRATLERDPKLGWWTRRLHITRAYAAHRPSLTASETTLRFILRSCPNLEICLLDWPTGAAFAPLADAFCTTCPLSLRTAHWTLPHESVAKAIWALAALPALEAAHIDVAPPEDEDVRLGSAADVTLVLRSLKQLCLAGAFGTLFEQMAGWALPALASLSLDIGAANDDAPDVLAFLSAHGSGLTLLDLNLIPTIDVASALAHCPTLAVLAFNADWRLAREPHSDLPIAPAVLAHPNVTHVGLHGLHYAFGVGYPAAHASVDPARALLAAQANDAAVLALRKANFPKLKVVRALGRTLLRDLEAADGPDSQGGARWERWWAQTSAEGVRLEDCTGALLGTLPQDPVEYPDSDDDEGSEEGEEGASDEETVVERPMSELQLLLEECRKMSATREQTSIVPGGWAPPDEDELEEGELEIVVEEDEGDLE